MANLHPPFSGMASGVSFADQPKCTAKRKDGKPCTSVRAYGTKVCLRHGAAGPHGKARPKTRALDAALAETRAARAAIGGDVPRDLARDPLYLDPPGATNMLTRTRARLALLNAWTAREIDGDNGAQWRQAVASLGGKRR